MIKEAYIWLGGCAAILAKSSKILLKEKGLGLLGSMVVVLAGVVVVVVVVVAAPKVKGELVTALSGFLSLSPALMVPKEKREVDGVEEGVAVDAAGVLVAVEVVVAAGAPKLNVGTFDFAGAGVVVEALVEAGVPKEKAGVAAAGAAVDLSSAGLLGVAAAGELNVNGEAAAAGAAGAVAVLTDGVVVVEVEGVAAEVAGFPKEKADAGVVLAVDEAGVEPNENGLEAAVVAAGATAAAGTAGFSVVLAPNPNVGVAGLSVAGLAPKLKADVAGVVVAGEVPKVTLLLEGVAVVELGVPKLKPPIGVLAEGVAVLAGVMVGPAAAAVAGALNEILDD